MERADISLSIPGDVCAPRGFRAAGIHCGVKKKGRPDLALLFSEEEETTAAATFTTNHVRAAPVRYCEEAVAAGRARAIVVNSGNANACTGDRGMAHVREMASLAADALGLDPAEVLVASTGIIGEPLPMEFIREGIPRAARDLGPSGEGASEAILTTDSFTKTVTATFEVGGSEVTVGGMAKGAGMIHPRMATMLGFLTTDARIPPPALRRALKDAVDVSFNRITVDGDTSTNDTVFLLANGASGAP
ncbi:MAG: bifunctional ornithine acetyltransferase/N-acetylglutamate synthase, partial [Longimicrobiales bacterium]|nr:bifunctional ornithine acetyltransferase/N-acetylglutamate synthase [Longimicrobiales bacterium]